MSGSRRSARKRTRSTRLSQDTLNAELSDAEADEERGAEEAEEEEGAHPPPFEHTPPSPQEMDEDGEDDEMPGEEEEETAVNSVGEDGARCVRCFARESSYAESRARCRACGLMV